MIPRRFFYLIPVIALMFSLFGSVAKVTSVSADIPTGLTATDWSQILALLPPAQEAYLKASNTNTLDLFGDSVAVSGDTIVVGAPEEGIPLAGDSGAAYVFTRSGGVWSQQAYLKASNPEFGDHFGYSVAVSGDTIVVGAWQEDSNATGVNGNQADNSADFAGAAYVFTRSGGVWSQQAYLKASNTGADDNFGISVAVSGDTIVVGAYAEDSNATGVNGDQTNNSATDSGAAYVFTRSGGVWSQQAYLKASNTDELDVFGYVAIDGNTIVVGAYGEDSSDTGVNGNQADNSASKSGAAYIFTRSGGVWSQQAYLKASNTGTIDGFGESVAVSGDTVVVGAPFEDSNAIGVNGDQADNSVSGSGAAYVFTRSGGVWNQQTYLKASNTGYDDYFGNSVAVSGDTIVVGAYRESSNATGVNGDQTNNSATDSGATYVFARNGGVWGQRAYLKASNTGASDLFGYPVAVSGDIIVVGAVWEDSNAVGVNGNQADNSAGNSGAAYVFATPSTFSDVPLDYWAWKYIESLYNSGITGGCSTNPLNYCPTQAVTRAQMAVFLLKGIHGLSFAPPAVNGSTGFNDVAVDYWAAAWIKQLAAEGITGGCGNGNYCPENTVTRDQMAIFLLRAEHGSAYTPPDVNGSTGFADVPVDYWAAAWIKQLAAETITGGCGSGVYCPSNPVTRDQMAVFLQRTFYLPLP
ncbi:MAG: S-layer homology domain-containing protein [Anaerolineales bacterium]|nr:S-layer homology domain-containing protein [Anaerolineales bacterium]